MHGQDPFTSSLILLHLSPIGSVFIFFLPFPFPLPLLEREISEEGTQGKYQLLGTNKEHIRGGNISYMIFKKGKKIEKREGKYQLGDTQSEYLCSFE